MDKPEEIFSDNHILILDKPAGMPTQSDDPQIMSLQTWGQHYLKQKLNKPGNVFLHPIHRLDKPVRGLVIFAKTSKALSRLNEQIKEGTVKKTYRALVEGTLKEPSGTLVHYLRHDEHRAVVCSQQDPLGKKAILEYRLIKTVPHGSLVEITLLTGRYHQIRAQFSAISHPVFGDRKYNSQIPYGNDEIALIHYAVEFLHPVTRTPLKFNSKKHL